MDLVPTFLCFTAVISFHQDGLVYTRVSAKADNQTACCGMLSYPKIDLGCEITKYSLYLKTPVTESIFEIHVGIITKVTFLVLKTLVKTVQRIS